MNFNQAEVTVVEEIEQPYAAQQLQELNALQLAFVGGGIGSVIFG